jgi:uncharacterized protein
VRSLLNIAAVLLALYIAWLGMLYISQRSVLFPGAGMAWRWDPQSLRPGAEPVALGASFGSVRAVFLVADTNTPTPALIYFHGNAEFVDQNIGLLQPITTTLGMHVLLVEYPGYAGSDGRPSRESLAEAARLGFDWVAKHPAVDSGRIIAMGRSIGSGPAVDLAGERDIAAVVLLSPFASLDMIARSMGAPGLLLRDRYDNRVGLAGFEGPVLLFHGRADDVIPYAHSQALLSVVPGATLQTLSCRHNDCPYFDAAFMRALEQFLSESGLLAAPDHTGG